MSVTSFSLPLATPLETADGAIEAREGFLLRYEHRGETGFGEATPLPGWTESLSACRSALTDALATAEREGHPAAMLDLEVSETPAARHGFTTALYDADARAEGLPLYRWFVDEGERHCESVPVNATLGDADVETTRDRAEAAVENGFSCLKVKVGARSLAADCERVAAVREAVGEDVALRVDANGAWDRSTASDALDRLAAHDLEYVEQPVPASDLEGLAALADGAVPIAADEALPEHGLGEILRADAADVVVCKPMVLGGPGDAKTLAHRALEAGVDPVVSTTVDGVVARTAAVHVAATIPDVRACGLATASFLERDLGPDPAPVADGHASVPQGPGLGIEEVDVDEAG